LKTIKTTASETTIQYKRVSSSSLAITLIIHPINNNNFYFPKVILKFYVYKYDLNMTM